MTVNCDVILRWGATPEQLTALGTALWHWCTRSAEDTGIYQYLDSQPLADLLAGHLPAARPAARATEMRRVHFRIGADPFPDRRAVVESLRRVLAAELVEDVLVEDRSWNLVN
jgi:hypothetical protein